METIKGTTRRIRMNRVDLMRFRSVVMKGRSYKELPSDALMRYEVANLSPGVVEVTLWKESEDGLERI